jgi:hypothetical protein
VSPPGAGNRTTPPFGFTHALRAKATLSPYAVRNRMLEKRRSATEGGGSDGSKDSSPAG